MVGYGFDDVSSQTKDNEIVIRCISAKHATLKE